MILQVHIMRDINHDYRSENASAAIDKANGIIKDLKANADLKYKEEEEGMGINTKNAYGVRIPILRGIARRTGFDNRLADTLWKSGIHEAAILASMVYDPNSIKERQLDSMIEGVDSWDMCDSLCGELFSKTAYADKKIEQWVKSDKEFVKRAGFVMIAYKALRNADASNYDFKKLFDMIADASSDDRNYVKKAVSWALREIGKRNPELNADAIRLAENMGKSDSEAAKWISKSVLSELQSDRVQKRLGKAHQKGQRR